MKRQWQRWVLPLLALILALTGCAEPGKHEVAGTLAGGALGAGAGAIIGHQTGHTGAGTAIGAGAGALGGNLIGRGIDEAARANQENNPPAGYNQTYTPPGAPPPPPPPGHYEWDPRTQRWIWRYDRSY